MDAKALDVNCYRCFRFKLKLNLKGGSAILISVKGDNFISTFICDYLHKISYLHQWQIKSIIWSVFPIDKASCEHQPSDGRHLRLDKDLYVNKEKCHG